MNNVSPDTTLALMNGTQMNAPSASSVQSAQKLQDLEKIARDFEAVFVFEMMKPMYESVDVDPVFGGGKGEEVFRGMLMQEYSKGIASRSGTGLQTQILDHLIKLQAMEK